MANSNAAQAVCRVIGRAVLFASVWVGTGCNSVQTEADLKYLAEAWDAYRSAYIQPEGYVLDRSRNGGEVTSEGQSYALLRSAWIGDQATFDQVLKWTTTVLQRPDGLFSWRWSPQDGGQVLDANSATDADQDIAFALLVASKRFDRPEFVDRARLLIRAIRAQEGIDVAGGWFPSAGNWAPAERIVNLSYFSPYAYPYFDRVDPDGRWMEAVRVGYDLLRQAIGQSRTRLPPDFLTVGPNGTLGPLPEASTLSRSFSFDGMRIPWRVALDCQLHGRAEACVAGGALPALVGALRSSGHLVSAYDTEGAPLTTDQSLSIYACLLPVLVEDDPILAGDVRSMHLSLDALTAIAGDQNRYYDLNWSWFGIASTSGLTVEHTPPPSAF